MRLLFFILLLLAPSFSEAQPDPPPLGTLTPPAAVTAAGSPVVLTWQDMSDNEVNFVVERRTEPFTIWETIAYVHWNMTTYTDRQLVAGRYYYRVYAENYSGPSLPSNVVYVDFVPPVLTAPVLTLSTLPLSPTQHMPVISWTPNPLAVGLHIDRKAPNSSWAYLPDTSAASGIYHDHRVIVDRKWCFRGRYFNATGDSPFSPEVCFP